LNYLKDNPKGVDAPIDRIQKILYKELSCSWNTDNLDGYGRIYRNERREKVIPEFYTNENEYKEVLQNDTKACIFFFNTGNPSVTGKLAIVDCEIIFSVDLTTIKGDETRDDEEIRNDVVLALNRYATNFEKDYDIIKDLDGVYEDFRGVADYFLDMQRFHHFKFKGKIRYNINC